ncbi:MAG: amidohydrolase family protein [Planctomycetales bacterium]|nr:amidohydrolase family protein [Planctomycetales bacterium]
MLKQRNFWEQFACVAMVLIAMSTRATAAADDIITSDVVRESVARSISLLQKAATGTADNRECFTCHGQAMPVLAMVESRRHGFLIDQQDLDRQIKHTHAHLKKGQKPYAKGKGQGGGVDTAGYALWTLEEGEFPADEVTAAVAEYLLQVQKPDGFWKCSSDRPPSESSDFTTTYLALRALSSFSTQSHGERLEKSLGQAAAWLMDADPHETEDVVFGLLSTDYLDVEVSLRDSLVKRLLESQRSDGGWSQKPDMESDAYATGTVLYALHRAGGRHDDGVWNRAVRYLIDTQLADGSWHVRTRSKPFQKYFETGFPHGTDQFISTSATAWATLALMFTLPEPAADDQQALETDRPKYSLILRGGTIVDGTGNPWYRGDVAIAGDRIVAIGSIDGRAARVIDAGGLVVAPGFVDMHSHSDWTLFEDGDAQSKIRQGVTTEILGEGASGGPNLDQMPAKEVDINGTTHRISTLGDYFTALEKSTTSVNVASYVGINNLWQSVMGQSFDRPSDAEIEQMKGLLADAMKDGAFGLSSQVMTPPGSLATTEDLVELCKVVHQYHGIYSTHIRNEGTGVFDSVAEAIAVGERADVPVDIIHLKIADQQSWGLMRGIIEMIEQARLRGVNVQANVYPYTRGNNNLSSIIPPWAHEGGKEKLLERLKNPVDRDRMKHDIESGIVGWYNHYTAVGRDWERMLISADSRYRGKTMQAVIDERTAGMDPKPDALDVLFDLLIEEDGSVSTVYAHHEERDMNLAMQQPWCSIGSDGSALAITGTLSRGNPHPRNFGTFPRVLGRYVRQQQLITLEQAVQKMTSLNAAKIGIYDRGVLRPGLFADITIFDPKTVIDQATYDDPFHYNLGIHYVIVNGQVVLDHDKHTGARPGRVIRKSTR